ncbi:hypothetical protein [Silanimonas sp.]|uniref:hypothetical protein n=1 Tax=Silanimonas sp. TaxID=1929290 RepID=UPI0022CC8B17|nr:hypothetical protein [Silanimonas sp.]MCZ8166665.1 hypothetical protein [Silanimonas sp.]
MSTRMTWVVKGKDMQHITAASPCYELPCLPPPDDFIVHVDEQGQTYRWRDARWVIGDMSFNFGYEPTPGQTLELTAINGELLKRCLAWFVWGARRPITVSTIHCYHALLKRLFATCSALTVPVRASEIGRFFDTIELDLAEGTLPSNRDVLVGLLHELWQARDWLGFEVLAPAQIARLRELVVDHGAQQKLFIPPRIWAYQAHRMQTFLQDFIAKKAQFEALFLEIADAYRFNYGSLSAASRVASPARTPCHQGKRVAGCIYLGPFADLAHRHGVAEVIGRWMLDHNQSMDSLRASNASPLLLGKYFSAVARVGIAYLQCLSGMRIKEALSLRSTCLSVEHDSVLGDICILSGETTKTAQDPDARWMAAPTASLAVEAMSAVAKWRMSIAVEVGAALLKEEDRVNPRLVQRAYEPWMPSAHKERGISKVRPPRTAELMDAAPGLFEKEALRITAEDELYLRRFSHEADLKKYGEGCIWHFQSHQYRRSIQVYMAASGVSLPSRQQQLKHLTSSQSAYYAHGHENLRLNRRFSHELVSVRYELVAVDAGLLNGPEYVSPHGQARKDALLRFFKVSSRDEIEKAQKQGQLTVRQTVVGICTARRCEYGGFDNYAHCTHCVDGLMDKRKRPVMGKEGRTIAARLVDVPAGTPLRAALERRLEAVEEFMHVTAA